MKAFGFVLAAVAAFALGSAPLAARAQMAPDTTKKDTKAAAAPSGKLDAKTLEAQRTQGKAEAPAVIQAAGVTCDMTDARFLGTFNMKEGDKSVPAKGYEVACKQGLGYVLFSKPGKPQAIDCLAAKGTQYACQLPDNATQTFAGYVASAPRPCEVTDSRAIGSDPSGKTFYEVACRNTPGFVIQLQPGAAPELIDCAQASGAIACKLTTKEQITAYIGQLAAKSGRQCQVSGARIVGQESSTGAIAYEVGCGSQPGFMFLADKSGKVLRTVDCADASHIFGSACTFTSADLAQAAGKSRYSQVAAAAGFPCQVSQFNLVGTDTATHRDVVEIACSNRPDGAFLMVGAQPGQTTVLDCIRAGRINQSCHLSSAAPLYPKFTAALAAHKRDCQVNNARWAGSNVPAGTILVEVACANSPTGWIIEVDRNNNASSDSPMSCGGQAQREGFECKLSGTAKH